MKEKTNLDGIMHVGENRLDELKPVYAIEATGTDGGPIAGQTGLLSERGKQLLFFSSVEAETRIKDIRGMCLNKNPVAELACVRYRETGEPRTLIRLEGTLEYDIKPDFDPNTFEVRSHDYGNTGGGCMVATTEIYLPELDKTLWVNTNDEGVDITTVDFIWNTDGSNSFERYDHVHLFSTSNDYALPDGYEIFAPMIKAAYEYAISREIENAGLGRTFPVRAEFLPTHFVAEIGDDYHTWLFDEMKCAEVGADGKIVVDEEYEPTQAQNDAPEMA